MKKIIRRASFLFIVIALLAVASSVSAQTISIADINDPNGPYKGSIIFGDKLFSDFSVTGIDPSMINVTGFQLGAITYIQFQGGFLTSNTAGADYGLFYSVNTLGGKIYAIDQRFNLSAAGEGGNVLIGETVFDSPGGSELAQSSVSFFNLIPDFNDPPGEIVQGDQLILSIPMNKIFVTKDIFLQANTGGTVGATWIEQSFHQVPEPGTLLLLGTGLAGLALYARRRRN